MPSVYIELHTSSAFSFLRAASLPEVLIDRAAMLGYPAVALLDRDGVSGAPRFHKAALAAGIKPLDRRGTNDRSRQLVSGKPGTAAKPGQARTFSLPVLCASQEGWRNLCRLLSRMKLRAPKGEGALAIQELDGFTTGLIAMPGRPLLAAERFGVGGLLDRIVGVFGRHHTYVELQRHLQRDQEDDNDALVCLAEAFRVPLIATGGVGFATPEERPLFDVLTSIREHVPLMRAGRRLAANAERYFKPPAQMARLFADRPDAIDATRDLADRLQFSMTDLGYRFPKYPIPDGETEISFLRKIAEVGARNRYRPFHDRARAQVARELDSDRTARAGRLLPDRLGHRQFLPAAGHPRAGPRLGGQQRRVLQPRHHRGRSGRAWSCCSSAFSPKSAASGPTSISTCQAAIAARK